MSKLYAILIIIVSLVLCNCRITLAQKGEIGTSKRIRGYFPYLYKKYETPGTLTFPVKAQHKVLDIRLGAGNFSMTNHDKDIIEIEALIHTVSLSQRKSTKFIQEFLKLSIIEDGAKVILQSKFNLERKRKRSVEGDRVVSTFSLGAAMGTPGSKIHLTIKVPPHLYVRVNDHAGNIKITDAANQMRIVDHSGNMTLENLSGKLKIYDHSGSIRAHHLQDSIYIRDGAGDIDIEDVKGVLTLVDGSGDIRITRLDGDLGLRDASGNIKVSDVSKQLNISDSSGNISLDNISYKSDENTEIIIKDKSGNIYLKNIHGSLKLRDRSGKVYRN